MGSLNEVTHILFTGETEVEQLNEVSIFLSPPSFLFVFIFIFLSSFFPAIQANQLALGGCFKIHELMKECLKKSAKAKRENQSVKDE